MVTGFYFIAKWQTNSYNNFYVKPNVFSTLSNYTKTNSKVM